MGRPCAQRHATLGAAAVLLAFALLGIAAPRAAASCAAPLNEVEAENCLPGTSPNEWDVSGAGSSSIQGYTTDISVNRGQTVSFKVDTPASDYRLDIYRMGWYGGSGARHVATVQPSAALPQNQPSCTTEASTGLISCANWAVSASWAVPATAVSGIYFAHLVREDGTSGDSHVVFVVRDDSGASNLLLQTSDTTWQAYNAYGGNSLYTGGPGGGPNRAYKVSYDRPFTTRGNGGGEDWVFNAEYPMVRWLERNGYDVSYTTGADSDRRGAELREHKVFLSVGHDEYWSGVQRTNVEAARDAGVNLAFFSGNEVFWKTRWENNYRTLVAYKETHANAKIDPQAGVWTGTWRDPRAFNPQGGRPENALTGTIFTVNSGTVDLRVPAADGLMRFWRGTGVAAQPAGAIATLGDGTIGYEWDEDLDNGARPAGLVRLSTTAASGVEKLQDYGSTYASDDATHHLTLYRDTNGAGPDALVFGAGTVQWSWGLDSNHDRGSGAPSRDMQQATLNLFADMGVQPVTRQADLNAAALSTDHTAPTTRITTPAPGPVSTAIVTIAGTASDVGGRVGAVEVSTNGGASWHPAEGRGSWRYDWTPSGTGIATLLARAADDSGNLGAAASVKVDVGGRNCPCTLFGGAFSGAAVNDGQPIEVGTRFRADTDGWISALWYYDGTAGGPAPVGHLWREDGTRLAEVQFPATAGTGWQRATLPAHVPVSAGTTYVTSYAASDGVYAAAENFFLAPLDAPPLHAAANAGVYVYGTGFPTQTFNATNYWADVEFDRPDAPPAGQPSGPHGGTGGSNGPVAHPSRVAARARVSPRRLRATKRGAIRLRVRCSGGEDGCRVRLRVRLGKRNIATRTVTVGGKAPRTVKVKLRRADRKRLIRKGKLRLTAVASVRDADGRRTVTRRRLTVLAPRGRK